MLTATYNEPVTSSASTRPSRVERILALLAIGIAVIAVACLVAVLVAPLVGVPGSAMVAPGWQVAFLVAYWGLPIAVLLLIGLVISRLAQNRRRRVRGS